MIKVALRPHTRRCRNLKLVVTLSCVLALVASAALAPLISLTGNLIWLWFDFD